jgi:hypothetical protein
MKSDLLIKASAWSIDFLKRVSRLGRYYIAGAKVLS